MKIAAIVWGSDAVLLRAVAAEEGISCAVIGTHEVDDPAAQGRFLADQADADLVLLHPSRDRAWDDLIPKIRTDVPVVSFGHDEAFWTLSTVPLKVAAAVSAYVVHGGIENFRFMVRYLRAVADGSGDEPAPPSPLPWEGIYHPDAPDPFADRASFRARRPRCHACCVGIVFSRTYWANGDREVVDALIRRIETFADVVPIFCLSMGDRELGARPGAEVAAEWFAGETDFVLNLQPVFHAPSADAAGALSRRVDCPVAHPVLLYHRSQEEWLSSSLGLPASEVGWSIALPEFEGMIEMLPVGTEESAAGTHDPIPERIERICRRVEAWLSLREKPAAERKVAFILHNNPCSSAEATVGAGAHLDTLESVARVLAALRERGYAVDPPADGKALIDLIMEKKAINDFRWTSVGSIVRSGGALAEVAPEEYAAWFAELDPAVRATMETAWGRPPGEEIDGIPPAMVHEGRIVVTGVSFGNAVVCVQPKRGCAGAKCDGTVCRILHDPETPPTHQYLATYRWLERVFGADAVIHVGTHGNLEFLPGKSVALSGRCFPDIAIGTVPHLYIYNADNPPEGTVAKRRAHATLVDHMQTVMQAAGLYGTLKDLEALLDEYGRARGSDPARAHALEHQILDAVREAGLEEETDLAGLEAGRQDFPAFAARTHRELAKAASSRIPDGMHIFGSRPEGEGRARFVQAALRFDDALGNALFGPGDDPAAVGTREGAEAAFVAAVLRGADARTAVEEACGRPPLSGTADAVAAMAEQARSMAAAIDASAEIESLLHALDGGFVAPGPAGLITRGHPEVLPTGRNFYSLDPASVPTRAAWAVGKRLADALIAGYRREHGENPRSVAMYWMSSDLMWADGEELAQMLALIGVEPVWRGGKVVSFHVIPLEDLGRPRIDITVRASGILRDCFFSCIELLDDAIAAVAALDEPEEMNPVRAAALKTGTTARIFSSRPGTYGNGVSLAVYSSAWKEEKDLAGIFIDWNGYAYGRDNPGRDERDAFSGLLAGADATFNKTATDEYDLCGCCCYFGTHGGMTAAARSLSGKHVPAYYGDTRTPSQVEVRTLAAELGRVVRTKLLNPAWIEGMKRHGYKGAGDIAKRVGRVYGWEAATGEVDDRIFDAIARTFVLDPENRSFFQESNPFALEEIGRRLLEAQGRGLWSPDPEVAERLRDAYLETEGWLEDRIDGADGPVQGGGVTIATLDEIRAARRREECRDDNGSDRDREPDPDLRGPQGRGRTGP